MASSLRILPALRRATVPRTQIWRTGVRAFSCRSALLEKKYTKSHEWVEANPDGKTATIGISEYAANALGDVVYVELPEVGLELKGPDGKGESEAMGAVESVKSASDIYAPVSGTITETNPVLEETPGTINKSPEGDGWLAKIELSAPEELDALMSKQDYDALKKGEEDH